MVVLKVLKVVYHFWIRIFSGRVPICEKGVKLSLVHPLFHTKFD
jgi:hypothetical protein